MVRSTKPPLESPPPLVTNDAAVALVGTGIWVAALVVALLSRSWLRQHDALWWMWVAVVGVGFGFTWGPYALWRRRGFLREAGLSDPGAPKPQQGPGDRTAVDEPDA